MMKKQQSKWRQKVKNLQRPVRLVDYAAKEIPLLGSKSAVKKALAKGQLFLNKKVASLEMQVRNGDFLELKSTTIQKAKKFDFDLEVIYEDDFLIIVNKPGGIAVNGNRNKTVENALGNINKNNLQPDALERAVAAHRIDVPTAGLVLLAKTKKALILLGKGFQNNQIKKEYCAVVHGKPTEKGTINAPIKGKKSITNFEVLQTVPSKIFKHLSLLKLQPITGRTHQLRIHLKDEGHLIVGDKLYAKNQHTILGKGLLLCACRLQFEHPISKKQLDFQIKPPPKYAKLLQREMERFLSNS